MRTLQGHCMADDECVSCNVVGWETGACHSDTNPLVSNRGLKGWCSVAMFMSLKWLSM